jgi:hypothetical protein
MTNASRQNVGVGVLLCMYDSEHYCPMMGGLKTSHFLKLKSEKTTCIVRFLNSF